MLSQCPHCRAIFNVSEPDIGAHHGLVRCGHCKAIFHAVINQVEDVHPISPEAPGTSTHELPFDDAGPPARGADRDESDRFPGPTPYLEPVTSNSPEHKAPVQVDPDRCESRDPKLAADQDQNVFPDDEDPVEAPGTQIGSADTEEESAWQEPVLPDKREAAGTRTGVPDLPGEITEEILIEAPPTLMDAFETELYPEQRATDSSPAGEDAREQVASDQRRRPDHAGTAETKRRAPRPETPTMAADQTIAVRAPSKSPYGAKDVRMVELPQPRPFKTASMSLLSVFLVLLLVWQVKTFYLEQLAQVPLLRPYLDTICQPLGCVLPPRREFARIELAGTSISINREVPGALAITVGLLNNAHFPQPYPPLRVTLTDREGRVVGRRTYLPDEYRADSKGSPLPIGEVRDVTINLAQPYQDVVGYEVELVMPRSTDGG